MIWDNKEKGLGITNVDFLLGDFSTFKSTVPILGLPCLAIIIFISYYRNTLMSIRTKICANFIINCAV